MRFSNNYVTGLVLAISVLACGSPNDSAQPESTKTSSDAEAVVTSGPADLPLIRNFTVIEDNVAVSFVEPGCYIAQKKSRINQHVLISFVSSSDCHEPTTIIDVPRTAIGLKKGETFTVINPIKNTGWSDEEICQNEIFFGARLGQKREQYNMAQQHGLINWPKNFQDRLNIDGYFACSEAAPYLRPMFYALESAE